MEEKKITGREGEKGVDGKQESWNLSEEEYKRLKNAFDSLDPDKTNCIELEDLRFLLRCRLRT